MQNETPLLHSKLNSDLQPETVSSPEIEEPATALFFADPYDVPETPVRFIRLVSKVRRTVREITPHEFSRLPAPRRPLLIDVREFSEWRSGRAEGAVHIPRGLVEARIENVVPSLTGAIVCYCSDGMRSTLAAESLQRLGYRNVASLAGGLTAWEAAGLPLYGRSAWD